MVTRFPKTLAAACIAAGLALATPVSASASQEQINATLAADAQLWRGLFALAVADEIRKNCDAIEARTVRATRFVYGLYGQARDYGYSRDQIRAFQRADSTEARMRAEVMAYFAQHGVREGVPDSYCALGRSEIAAGSQAGELLRAR